MDLLPLPLVFMSSEQAGLFHSTWHGLCILTLSCGQNGLGACSLVPVLFCYGKVCTQYH